MGYLNPFSKYKKLKKLREKEPNWVSWFVGFLAIFYFFSYLIAVFYNFIFAILGILISLFSASVCLNMAKRKKGYPTLAFGIGFLGLLGILFYWLGQKWANLKD